MPDTITWLSPEQWRSLEELQVEAASDAYETTPVVGNMFSRRKLLTDLDDCRVKIRRAVLIAHRRRQLREGDAVPDLKALRKLEVELIVRLDMLGGVE